MRPTAVSSGLASFVVSSECRVKPDDVQPGQGASSEIIRKASPRGANHHTRCQGVGLLHGTDDADLIRLQVLDGIPKTSLHRGSRRDLDLKSDRANALLQNEVEFGSSCSPIKRRGVTACAGDQGFKHEAQSQDLPLRSGSAHLQRQRQCKGEMLPQ